MLVLDHLYSSKALVGVRKTFFVSVFGKMTGAVAITLGRKIPIFLVSHFPRSSFVRCYELAALEAGTKPTLFWKRVTLYALRSSVPINRIYY